MERFMKSNLDIAMFGHKRIPSREGGIEIVVEELCTRMVNKGNRVTCYNRAGHHVSGAEYDTKAAKEYKGIRLKKVPTIEKKGLAAVSLYTLLLLLYHTQRRLHGVRLCYNR